MSAASRAAVTFTLLLLCGVLPPSPAQAEVTGVTILSRTTLEGSFGSTGTYERLIGRVEFALDPEDPANASIVDLASAARGADGKVHFSSDLYVLQPSDPARGNGVLLFELPNRGVFGVVLGLFNRGAAMVDVAAQPNVGDGLLMRDGYTLVWLGWEFDVPMPRLRLEPPPARLPAGTVIEPLSVDIVVNDRVDETVLVDEPVRPPVPYPPADPASTASTLTVRQQFWGEETVIPRDRWRFTATPAGLPMVRLDGGFEPGLWYRVSYEPANPVVAGVALAAIRDAAAAFRYRTDLPVRGDTAYAFGQSQTGRLLREFLYGGFNVDREGRRVFDAMWVHIAGAARGSFNRRFATPAHGDMYLATRAPFADVVETDADGTSDGLQARYPEDIRPRIFYTNTPVEYWGGGRAAALTHTSVDGERDLPLPDNLRMYVLAGTQHLVAPFPPVRVDSVTPGDPSVAAAARSDGQQPSNPTPQANIMRGLLRAWHAWAADDVEPPSSRYPRLADGTLVTAEDVSFPALPGVSDPRRIEGPAQVISGQVVALPHLVPQVDVDGNDLAGVHDPEAAVPLATTTGWNFRAARVGNPDQLYQTLGSYIPFARTRSEREALGDPRRSIEERYVDREDVLRRVRDAANELVGMRLMLEEDVDDALARAAEHWSFATGE